MNKERNHAGTDEERGDGGARGDAGLAGAWQVCEGGGSFTTIGLGDLRASQINGCSVCVDMHTRYMKDAGETDERLFTVAAWRGAPYFTDAEGAALALTEAGTRLG